MYQILKQILKTGIKSETPPQGDESLRVLEQRLQQDILDVFGGALAIRMVDAGSCNGCELEIHAVNNAYYNLEGLGIKFVASPRHADLLLVTGPVSRHMEVALKRTYDAVPEPKLVVAIGECACDGGIFCAADAGENYQSAPCRPAVGHRPGVAPYGSRAQAYLRRGAGTQTGGGDRRVCL